MSDWLAVILLGIIEGVTEFLPVSSTGHLLLTEHLIGRTFSEVFNVVIQCGAVLAVLVVFAKRAKEFATQFHKPAVCDYLLKLAAAFVVTVYRLALAITTAPLLVVALVLTEFVPAAIRLTQFVRLLAPCRIRLVAEIWVALVLLSTSASSWTGLTKAKVSTALLEESW